MKFIPLFVPKTRVPSESSVKQRKRSDVVPSMVVNVFISPSGEYLTSPESLYVENQRLSFVSFDTHLILAPERSSVSSFSTVVFEKLSMITSPSSVPQ